MLFKEMEDLSWEIQTEKFDDVSTPNAENNQVLPEFIFENPIPKLSLQNQKRTPYDTKLNIFLQSHNIFEKFCYNHGTNVKLSESSTNPLLVFLYRLLSKNSNFSKAMLNLDAKFENNTESSESDSDSNLDEDNIFNKNKTKVNSLDYMIACFSNSELLMQNILVSNLDAIGSALPLVTPDLQMRLYPFMQIQMKTRKCDVKTSVLNYPFITVSFLKLKSKKLKFSKSKMISDAFYNKHEVFINYSQSGYQQKNLSEGLIEISFHNNLMKLIKETQEVKDQEFVNLSNLDELVTILNLRGDFYEHKTQAKFLQNVSNVMVLVCYSLEDEFTKIQHFLDTSPENTTYLIFVFKKSKNCITNNPRIKIVKLSKKINESMLNAKLVKYLFKFIQDIKLEELMNFDKIMNMSSSHGIECDFLSTQIKNIFEFSSGLLQEFGDSVQARSSMSQQQYLSQKDKQFGVEKNSESFWKERKNLPVFAPLASFYNYLVYQESINRKTFIDYLSKELNRNSIAMFLEYKKMNDLINIEISKMSEKKLQATSNEETLSISDVLEQLYGRKKLNAANFDKNSFGIEHIFRELYNIYEVDQNECPLLPEIMVDLLLQGNAIELLDGDNFNICVRFWKSILNLLQIKFGNNRILVLSVLGLQSSGKSTLLNSLFNLNFPVSEGRCTRGAYVQFLQIEEATAQYKYILLIDTEGLRSAEIGSNSTEGIQRDNKLAAMAIALSDLVLINVFGENATEISDMLPIVGKCIQDISATNKCSETKMIPTIYFVHQATYIKLDSHDELPTSITSQIEIRISQIKSILAKIIKACNVNISDNIDSYITLTNKNVQYFRPYHDNGYVSHEYSDDCQTLKRSLLTACVKNRTNLFIFENKLNIVWTGIQTGVFYFDARSSIEMYETIIMKQYIETLLYEFEKKTPSVIQNAKNNIEIRILNPQNLPLGQLQIYDYKSEFEQLHKIVLNQFETPNVLKNENIEVSQSKFDLFKLDLDLSCQSIIKQCVQEISNYEFDCQQTKTFDIKSEIEKKSLDDKIFQRLNILKKDKINKTEYLKQSEKIIDELLKEHPKPHKENIHDILFSSFSKSFICNNSALIYPLSKIKEMIYQEKYPKLKPMKAYVDISLIKFVCNIFSNNKVDNDFHVNILNNFLEKLKNDRFCSPKHLIKYLRELSSHFNEVLSKNHIRVEPNFFIDVAIVFTVKSIKIFQDNSKFIEAEYAKKVELKKEEMYRYAIQIYDCRNDTEIEFTEWKQKLLKYMYEQAKESIILANLLNIGAKKNVIIAMMAYYTITNRANLLINGVLNIKHGLQNFLIDAIDYKLEKYSEDLKFRLVSEQKIFNDIFDACKGSQSLKEWVNQFIENSLRMNKNPPLPKDFSGNNEKEQFQMWNELLPKVVEDFTNQSINLTNQDKKNIIKKYIETRLGCLEQCPLCSNICDKEYQNHEDKIPHSCDLHFSNSIKGWRTSTTSIGFNQNCFEGVVSNADLVIDEIRHPYKDYRNHPSGKFKDWEILAMKSDQDMKDICLYILSKFKYEFEEIYAYIIREEQTNIFDDEDFVNVICKKLTNSDFKQLLIENLNKKFNDSDFEH